MEHPFNTKMELNISKTEQVAGGAIAYRLPIAAKLPSPAPIKPPMETTMAIGEEGGSFGTWY